MAYGSATRISRRIKSKTLYILIWVVEARLWRRNGVRAGLSGSNACGLRLSDNNRIRYAVV